MRFIIIITLFTLSLFSATKEQVEKYFIISNSASDIVDLENSFQKLQELISPNSQYDTELITIRFKEKLQQNLSNDEMDEVIANYNNLLYARVIRELNHQVSKEDIFKFKQKNSFDKKRLDYITDIVNNIYKKEFLSTLFDKLQKPLITKLYGNNSNYIEKMKEQFTKQIYNDAIDTLYYNIQDFTLEDLESVAKFTKKSSVYLEQKATLDAMVYATKEFLNNIKR